MKADAALHEFFNKFGIPAYPNTAVPDDAKMPYITYDLAISYFDEGEINVGVSVWYKTESESIPTEKAMEIGEEIGRSGNVIPIDNGYIWIKRGTPFCQAVADEDNSIKRRYLNIVAEYLT